MSSYNNVKVLLEITETYNQKSLVDLLENGYANTTEELAEDIAFVLISLWGMVPKDKQNEFKERLTDDIVDHEISLMFDPEEEEE